MDVLVVTGVTIDCANDVGLEEDDLVLGRGGAVLSVGDIAVTREQHLRAGFVGFETHEVADILVVLVGVCGGATGEAAGFDAAVAIAGADDDLRGAQLIGERGEVEVGIEIFGAGGVRRRDELSGTTLVCGDIEGELVTVIGGEDTEGQADVLQVVDALNALGFGFGFGQGREEHSGQDGDDRDNDQELNEREGSDLIFPKLVHSFSANCVGLRFANSKQTELSVNEFFRMTEEHSRCQGLLGNAL